MFSKIVVIILSDWGLKKTDSIFLEVLSDIHWGHRGFDSFKYKQAVDRIAKNNNRFTLFLGDQIDAINIYDKRFNPDSIVEHDIDNQTMGWQKASQPLFDIQEEMKEGSYPKCINEKVWGLEHGNHEYNVKQITRPYIENRFCSPNNIDFLGARAQIGVRVFENRKTFKKDEVLSEWSIALMHGSGGGTPENMFREMKKNWNADIYVCGHLHQKMSKEELVYDFDWETGKSYARPIYLVNAGTFQNTLTNEYDGYMDRKNGIVATGIGTQTLEFNAYENKVNLHG